jgi:hypothetical protein
MSSVVDREAHHFREAERAKLAEQEHPRVERAWNAGCEEPCARHELQTELLEARDARRGRRRTLTVDHQRLAPARTVVDDRDLPARAVEVGLHHLEGQPGGDSRVEGIAP